MTIGIIPRAVRPTPPPRVVGVVLMLSDGSQMAFKVAVPVTLRKAPNRGPIRIDIHDNTAYLEVDR